MIRKNKTAVFSGGFVGYLAGKSVGQEMLYWQNP